MFDFSRYKYLSISLSLVFIVLFFIKTYAVNKGFAHSLDFDGGMRAVIAPDSKTSRVEIEKYFKDKDIEAVIILLDKEKNHFQVDIGYGAIEKIRNYVKLNESQTPPTQNQGSPINQSNGNDSDISKFILMLKKDLNLKNEQILSADQVGAVVGGELAKTGSILLISTLVIITIYVSIRFQFKFALAATLALVHDLFFTIGFIGFFQIKPSVPIIAALLTILGYSINDTIVVFDRIRENSSGKMKDAFSSIINRSINQTMGRTINTSVATMISVIAIIIGGAVELYDFAYVLVFGIVIGTYSSIFIAAPVVEIYDLVKKPS